VSNEYTEYQDGEGKKAFLNTKVSVDNSARNKASLSPNRGAGAEQYNNAMSEEIEENEEEQEVTQDDQMEALEIALDETLNAMFEGTDANPEFVDKIKTIFVAALNEKVAIIEDAILDASQELIEERVDEATEVLTEQIDNYLTYVAEEWLTENRLQVEQGFRTEIAENFMRGLKELFENSFVDVPEDKHDIVDDLFTQNSELEDTINKTLAENIDLKNQLIAHECATAFVEMSSDLADTEVEKLQKLAEGIEFNNVEQYVEKLNLLKESYFGTSEEGSVNKLGMLNEEISTPNTARPFADNEMTAYVHAISKLNKNTKKTEK
jgi:hypothetical protein